MNRFYGYWQSYSTKRPFYSLDKWDLRQADNRRISRAMEKENKKLRDSKKKEWNESVRELAGFVRKRDPRVKAYRKLLEEKAQENQKKVVELQEQQRIQRQELLASHKHHDTVDLEKKYRELENALGDGSDEDSEVEEIVVEDDLLVEDDDPLYCITCEKRFKSYPAMRNHIKSNLHRRNMSVLREELLRDQKDEDQLAEDVDNLDLQSNSESDQQDGSGDAGSKTETSELPLKLSETRPPQEHPVSPLVDRKKKKKTKPERTEKQPEDTDNFELSETVVLAEDPGKMEEVEEVEQYQSRNKVKKEKKTKQSQQKVQELGLRCAVCKKKFDTRNKLFHHIKDEGHAILK